jgi:uncharacterized protein
MEVRVARHIGLLFLVLFGLTPVAGAQDQAATVTAMGEAVIRRPPDRVIVTLAAESRGMTPQEAQAKGAVAMKAVQAAVDALRLPGAQVMTTGLYLTEVSEMVNGRRVVNGYLDRHSIVVRLDDVGRAGDVMTAATAAGATSIGGLRFERHDREALEEEALKLAVGVARARAEAMAAGAGKAVDRVLRIAEERAAAFAGAGPGDVKYAVQESVSVTGSVPIASGEIEIRMRVLLTASIR